MPSSSAPTQPAAPASSPEAWYLLGPTAVGKSAIALELAERGGGEIISVDSMQVYRGLDIGTAKPSAVERARVPHHLIDVVGLEERFDAARFVAAAKSAEQEIRGRNRVPIYCGGTGFYLKALLDGLGDGPTGDADLRAELEATPIARLLDELQQRDPKAFESIDRKNLRRVVRAVEVIRLTGRPFSEQRAAAATGDRTGRLVVFAREPADLRRRVEERVDRMFAEGLIAETERLLRQGLADNRTAMQAIGYRQVVEHLRGERSLPETIALIKTRTWQFARRQLTWLRHQVQAEWIALDPATSPSAAAAELGTPGKLKDFV